MGPISSKQVRAIFLTSFLIPFEMLFVNLFVIDSCSEKKYSRSVTYGLIGVFCVLLFSLAGIVSLYTPPLRQGNGLFVFWGFLYIIPLRLLYNNSYAKIISLACTSWIYTFIIFSLSVHIAMLIPSIKLEYATLLLQSILYIITLIAFRHLLKDKFVPVLSQLSSKEAVSLMWMSIVWFWTVIIINLTYIYPEIIFLRIIAILSMSTCVINFFRYIHLVITSDRTIVKLEELAYRDNLTQLRSRTVLQNDTNMLIDKKIPFFLVFMDLDSFKTINDTYGHLVGDEYLAFFAKEVKQRLGSHGGFYRIAGDEFVCIYTESNPDIFLSTLSGLPATLPGKDVPFIGVSYGVARHPEDGVSLEALLQVADENMYSMKQGDSASEE